MSTILSARVLNGISNRAAVFRHFVGVLICLFFVFLFLFYFQDAVDFVSVDLLQYWSAAIVYREGGDPYSYQELLDKQHAVVGEGFPHELPIRMYNPPLIFPIIWGLSFGDFHFAKRVWFATSVLAYVLSVWLLSCNENIKGIWKTNAGLSLMAVIASWYPFYLCLSYGQISCLLLLGLAISIRFLNTLPFISGLALSLTLLKPHLLWLVYLLALGGMREKGGRWLVGGILCGATTLLMFALFGNSRVLHHYFAMESGVPIHFLTPTIGSWLMTLFPEPSTIVRLLPTILFGGWFAWHHRVLECAASESSPLNILSPSTIARTVPLSLLFSPYGWPYDCTLCLPAVLYLCTEQRWSGRIRNALFLLLLSNLILFILGDSVSGASTIWYLVLLVLLVNPLRPSPSGAVTRSF